MQVIQFPCEFCGSKINADAQLFGTRIFCSSCGKRVSVPPISSSDLGSEYLPLNSTFHSTPNRSTALIFWGWVASGALGAIWIFTAATSSPPSNYLVASIIGLSVSFLCAFPHLRKIFPIPAGRLILIFATSTFVSFQHGQKLRDDRSRHQERIAQIVQSIQRAQQFHARGDLEGAIDILDRTDTGGDMPSELEHTFFSVKGQYNAEKGKALGPELASLIATAKAAVKENDRPKAIDVLTQATEMRFSYTAGYKEAEELLNTIKPQPPAPQLATPSESGSDISFSSNPTRSITLQAYNQIQVGWTKAQVKALLGTPDGEDITDVENVKIVMWQFQRQSFGFLNATIVSITVMFENDLVVSKSWMKV